MKIHDLILRKEPALFYDFGNFSVSRLRAISEVLKQSFCKVSKTPIIIKRSRKKSIDCS